MKKKLLLASILTIVVGIGLSAQTRIAVYRTDLSELPYGDSNRRTLSGVASQIVQFYATNAEFTVIDRANLNLIKKEQELQKSEEFIDGYVVDQGKQEGADYIFYSKYLKKEKSITVRVYDVASGEIKCAAEEPVNSGLGIVWNARSVTTKLLTNINADCFSMAFEIVRILEEKKSKARELLLAAGRGSNVKEGHVYDIFVNKVEKVGDKELTRQETIGIGVVIKVEDQNFSVIEVDEGGAAIHKAISAGDTLYCKLR